ncbi:unnamed protein product [Phytophthora fragariaefolia]|uniref:Unnamed protein product n=1 Tax=Phytophthora fragariaefolia TaxID=1490495 RepID=A0A9W7CXL1_9STRA|nr:unnamed protein product [Phytophthora fragariaefolia]
MDTPFSFATFCMLLTFSRVTATSNWIGLYQYAHFSDLVLSLRDVKTQTCYNLLCEGVNNVASSAAWLGWTSPSGDSQITFFMDKDCKGSSQGYQASGEEYPSDFSADGMDNKITSLISNRCFNIACGDYKDAVSSVEWSGLPTKASFGSNTKAHIVFYVNKDCAGKSKRFSTSLGSVPSFVDQGINDEILSFMVLETSEKVENGEISICSLESVTLDTLNVTTSTDAPSFNNQSLV